MATLTFISYIFVAIFQATPDSLEQIASNQEAQEIQEELYLYNEETGEFTGVPLNVESVDSLLEIGSEYRNRDSRKSFHAISTALNLSRDLGYEEGEARAHNLAGIKYADFGDYDHALEHYLLSMEIEERLGNGEQVASLLNNKALIYAEQESYEQAANYLQQSIDLRDELGLKDEAYLAVNNLGVVYRRLGEYDQALRYFREAEQLSLDVASDSLIHMIATLNIGNTYRNKGEFDKVLPYFDKASQYFDKTGNKNFQSASNLLYGQLFKDLGEYSTALEHTLLGLELAEEELLRERMKDAHELLAELYERRGDYESAYRHYQEFHGIHDTLLSIQRSNQINEMQIQFEVEQRNKEIQLLQQESALQEAQLAQQELWRTFLFVGLILLLLVAGLMYYLYREKKKSNRMLIQRREEIEAQNKELVKLTREKDEFTSMAAHDLRNPLSVIKTVSELLESENRNALTTEEADEYSELLRISTDRMTNLINNVLDIRISEQNDGEKRIEPVHVGRSVKTSLQHFLRSADSKKINLETDLDEEADFVLADKNMFVRILDNLISNAIKYSPPETNVKISSYIEGSTIRIRVEDEGPGIGEEDRPELFKKFARLSNHPTGNEDSTGLGLYIVKKLTHAMNGRVWHENKPGRGSVFTVELPRISSENRQALEHSGEELSREKA